MRTQFSQLWSQITNLRVAVISLLVLASGTLLLWWSSDSKRWENNVTAQVFLAQVGATLVAAVGLFLAWELAAKRSFAREVMASAGLGGDVENSGLAGIGNDYQAVDWETLFKRARRLEIFVAYAASWRNVHDARIKAMLDRPGTEIIAYLADESDDALVASLARRFDSTTDKVKMKISEATEEYNRLGVGRPGTVTVVPRADAYLYAAYKFDDTIVVTMYSHTKERTGVPTFIFERPGTLFWFFDQEFAYLSEPAPDTSETNPPPPIPTQAEAAQP